MENMDNMENNNTPDKSKSRGAVALKAGIWYVISNIVVKAIAVITTPLFTRMMTTEEYGIVQNFISWNTLLLPIFTLNLTYSIGRAKLDIDDDLENYVGTMQIVSAAFSLVISFIAIILIGPVSSLFELSRLQTYFLLFYLFFGPAITLWQNSYRYRYKYKQNIMIAWYTALSTTAVSIVLMLLFKNSRADMRMLGLTVPTVVLSLYFWIKAIAHRRIHFNRKYIGYGLKISAPLILHTISLHILSQSDRIFITKIWGASDTAFYSLAYTYGVLLHVFTTAVAEGWLPWFHDTYYEGDFANIRKNVKPLIVFGCYVGLACAALAPEAIMILGGKEYTRSIYCVPPVVLGVVCQYIYTHYVNIEMHLKKTMYVSYGTIFAAVLNIVLNAIFIPKFGFIAAAYTTLVSYFALMIVHFLITRLLLKAKLYSDLFMFGAVIITAVLTSGIMLTYEHSVIRYCVIAAGLISFFIYFRGYIINWVRKRKKKS